VDRIDLDKVARTYNELDIIWNDEDKWHLVTKRMISNFINTSLSTIPEHNTLKILNAGSAGYSYGIKEDNVFHVDIAEKRISHLTNSLVANVEELPLESQQFDMVICVGSVLNYCDPFKVAQEFSRVLKKSAFIILEFESSYTFELVFKKGFNNSAVFVETFLNNDKEKLWYFSETYIKRLLSSYNFEVVSKKRCHILSPLAYRMIKNEKRASWFSKLDQICSYVPGINKFCSNAIYLFKRKENSL
jgi:SAM-dependent methyltransferase